MTRRTRILRYYPCPLLRGHIVNGTVRNSARAWSKGSGCNSTPREDRAKSGLGVHVVCLPGVADHPSPPMKQGGPNNMSFACDGWSTDKGDEVRCCIIELQTDAVCGCQSYTANNSANASRWARDVIRSHCCQQRNNVPIYFFILYKFGRL